ncbi:MAG TPA: hypothetical protein VI231_02990 [Candidatus Binatia bacterium]|jgi:hypothetical protein
MRRSIVRRAARCQARAAVESSLTPPHVYTIIPLFPMETSVISKPKRIPFLDDMRGIAILAVFLFHCTKRALGHELTPATFGGVAMFFVLSGFCIRLACRGGEGRPWRGLLQPKTRVETASLES